MSLPEPKSVSQSAGTLLGQSEADLRALAESLDEPAYRGAQLYHALYAERQLDLAAMTNLPAAFRERLKVVAPLTLPQIVRRHHSADGTVRYVLSLGPGAANAEHPGRPATIEAVFMPEEKPPDDLHFHASRLRGGLPFLPDGAAGADSQSFSRRKSWARCLSRWRTIARRSAADQRSADGPG